MGYATHTIIFFEYNNSHIRKLTEVSAAYLGELVGEQDLGEFVEDNYEIYEFLTFLQHQPTYYSCPKGSFVLFGNSTSHTFNVGKFVEQVTPFFNKLWNLHYTERGLAKYCPINIISHYENSDSSEITQIRMNSETSKIEIHTEMSENLGFWRFGR